MKPLKIGAYLRVSTDEQVNTYEGSLDSQKHRIEEFVAYKNKQTPGWGEVVNFYVEEGISAGTTNRPKYQEVMADIRKGKVNLILVSDLTRLSRNLLDFCALIHELEKHHASYLSMKEQFDTSTPIGRMMVYIIIALGQFEREQTSERVSVNCHSRAMRGLVNGGAAPLGFNKHPDKPGLLQVDEAEAQIVRTIFEMFLAEGSRSKTMSRLSELGIFPKKTSERSKGRAPVGWTFSSLGTVLRNRAYIGLREINKVYKDEEAAHLKPWQKHQIVKAAWPALISEKTFFEAQHLYDEAVEKERTRSGKSEQRVFLLTGLLTCGETNLPLVGQAGHSSNGSVFRYYHYARRPRDVEFVRPRLNADEIEEKVIAEFKRALQTKGYFTGLEKLLSARSETNRKGSAVELELVRRDLKETTARISSVWASQARMTLTDEALRLASDELNRLAKQKQVLEKRLSVLAQIGGLPV